MTSGRGGAGPEDPLDVLVVDDSAVVRQGMLGLLSRDPGIRVTVAADPLIAAERMKKRRPHVIVLDLAMPHMDGLTFLRQLMASDPIPVVVCSAATGPGTEPALRALEEGAVEVIAKPRFGVREFLWQSADNLIQIVRGAATAKLRRKRSIAAVPAPEPPAASALRKPFGLVAVGVSTGGPDALRVLLGALPADAPAMLIVQHMPPGFTAALANRLDEVTPLTVREAREGDEVVRGLVLVAPGDRHMLLTRNGARFHVALNSGPRVSGHRPSIDVLFDSVARAAGSRALGVLLTGMGSDGATGLMSMKRANAATIAQSEESCIVFGMPKQAIARGAVDRILPIEAIAPAIVAGMEPGGPHQNGERTWNGSAS
jgi:two-component system chemotaxis response regulator CheB